MKDSSIRIYYENLLQFVENLAKEVIPEGFFYSAGITRAGDSVVLTIRGPRLGEFDIFASGVIVQIDYAGAYSATQVIGHGDEELPSYLSKLVTDLVAFIVSDTPLLETKTFLRRRPRYEITLASDLYSLVLRKK